MEEVKEKIEFKLPNKKIIVEPIIKDTPFLPKEHEAAFLANNAKWRFTVPLLGNGNLVNVLTKEEKEFFEDPTRSGMDFEPGDLSIYKKTDNFWERWEYYLGKTAITLDLSNPNDYITYKVLKACRDVVAPSVDMIRAKATYKYVLVDTDEQLEQATEELTLEEKCWDLYKDMKNDRVKMINVLKLFGRRPNENSTDSFLQTSIRKEFQINPSKFIDIVDDEDFDLRVFIEKAIDARAILQNRNVFKMFTGDVIARSNKELLNYLKSPKHQDDYLAIQAHIGE